MAKPPDILSPLIVPLSEEEVDELEAFFLSDAVPEESMVLDSLDGYLTAIVIGPTTLRLSDWFPGIWGPGGEAPEFAAEKDAQRIMELIMRHMNGIVWSFEHDPDAFEPLIGTMSYPGDSREYLDAEMWAYGFMQGVALRRDDWKPLFDAPEGADILRPLYLLGADDLPAADRRKVRTPAQRDALAEQLPASLAEIYRYWLPYRKAAQERILASTIERQHPKVGRNDPCPCGSGRKFKKCCGAAATLH